MTSEILGLLDNTLIENYKHSRSNRENLRLPIISNYLKTYRVFDILFLHFWYWHEISDSPLIGNREYSRSNRENLQLPIQMNLSKSCKHFALFWLNFSNLHEISNIPTKKNEYHRSSISELIESWRCVFKCITGLFSENALEVNLLLPKTSEICRKVLLSYFLIILSHLELKRLSPIRSEILGLLDNTLTWNYGYSRSNGENIRLPIQMRFSKEP